MLDVNVPHPAWGSKLKQYYWIIRVEGRNRARRRKYYRYVKAERLRLVESGLDQNLVDAYCRYLSNHNPQAALKFLIISSSEPVQLKLF